MARVYCVRPYGVLVPVALKEGKAINVAKKIKAAVQPSVTFFRRLVVWIRQAEALFKV